MADRRYKASGAFAALALAMALAVWLLPGRDLPSAPDAAAPPTRRTDLAPTLAITADWTAQPSPVPASAPRPAPVAAPVVDEVRVEKEEVCEGEENLVTVRAHTTDGNDAFLHYAIGSEAGAQVPLRAYISSREGRAVGQSVTVFGKGNVSTTVAVPAYRVKDCRPQVLLLITARALPNTISQLELGAAVRSSGGRFTPVRYAWSFGDGAVEVTRTPIAVHDYSARPQRTAFTQVLVAVKASDAAGETVEGRLALQLANPAFESRRRGIVAIFSEPTPRFPTMDPDGVVRQRFRMWHDDDGPVEIRKATMTRLLTASQQAPQTAEVDVATLLERTDILPGAGHAQAFRFDFAAEPAVYAVTYELEGVSAGGLRAYGQLTMLRPPARPTRENSTPIADPALAAKIRKAMAILGQDTVSQEDLWRLEREGQLR
jgi:hypothetical protein